MKRVFLIDDEEIANYINEWTIKNLDIFKKIDVFLFAQDALKALQEMAAAGEDGPDVILLDINMKPMHGFQFLDEFSKLPEAFSKKIKVLMLTSSLNERDRIKSYEYGSVAGFLNKPLAGEAVQEFVEKFTADQVH